LLHDRHEVVGVDRRPWIDAPIAFHVLDVRKRAAEEVFRKTRPHAVIHMATVSALDLAEDERHAINLGSTRAVFEYSQAYGVEHCVFVGRHTFYGAGPDLPLFHREDEPPQELNRFPELADLVAADLYAATALWRSPELTTTVLRFCYTLGPSGAGTLARFLHGRRVPLVLGFDPLFQFMHEDDVVTALATTIDKRLRGIFNVAGPQPLPLSNIVRVAGRVPVRLPEFVIAGMLGRFGLPRLPTGALAHLKYPVVIDARSFSSRTGFVHAHDELSTVKSFREEFP
jgi:UDP-glucose 4-epimerase